MQHRGPADAAEPTARNSLPPADTCAESTLSPSPRPNLSTTSSPRRVADPLTDQQRAYLTLLFNKYRGPLYRYLSGLVRSTEDVAELVQETYFRIMRHTESMRLEAIARSYLFHTAANVAREFYRRRSRRHANGHVDLDEADIDSLPDEITLETQAVFEDALARLKAEVRDMPLHLREVVVLHRFQHRTYPEIAQLLGVSVRTVERRIARAVDWLTTRMRGVL